MNKYGYTLKENSDSTTEIMDVIDAPDIRCAYEIVLNNIEYLNSKQTNYIWKLAQIEHGDFSGINEEKHQCNEKCDYGCDCDDDCCDDKEYGDYDQDHMLF